MDLSFLRKSLFRAVCATAFLCFHLVGHGYAQYQGATSLDTHTGYFEARTLAPQKAKQGGWNQSGQFNPPSTVRLDTGNVSATQISANGLVTAITDGHGSTGLVLSSWADVTATVGAEATAQPAAVVADIAESDANATSTGTFVTQQNRPGLFVYVFIHENVTAPASIVYGSLAATADGTNQQMRYTAGKWQIWMMGLGWQTANGTVITLTVPHNFLAGNIEQFHANASILTQTGGANGSFGSKMFSAGVASY